MLIPNDIVALFMIVGKGFVWLIVIVFVFGFIFKED